jgi:hypothetical protein
MAHKSEISWTRTNADGERLRVYAYPTGTRWNFFTRQRRYERWQAVDEPPLEDWLELRDAVQRRVARRRLQPGDLARLDKAIRERFPDADL